MLWGMRGRRRLAAVVAAMLVLAAPAAAATFSSGSYGGKTAQGKRISFKANFANTDVTKLKFSETGKCNNGDKSKGNQGPLNATVSSKGKFHITGKSPSGATKLSLNGVISGTKAHGSFTLVTRFTKAGKASASGSVKCATGKVKWSAKLGG
ncbi:MAG: hypothetical protein QOK25_1470 [Thermoleophilaceae bacterium]|nr:hypothetical protein [Thermoleophilaceae bacterium]